MGKVRVALFVLATALVLAGCVSRTGGTPDRAGGEDVALEYPSIDLELDPCSLTGPAAFEPYGTATMPGRPDMDSCRVRVATEQGPVFVWVGDQRYTHMLPDERIEIADLGRGAKLVRLEGTCDTVLTLSGGQAILATTTTIGTKSPPQNVLCGLTKGAAQGVFNVLAGGRAEFWRPAPDSLANVSACEALDWPLVAEQLGLEHREPTAPVWNHWCQWGETRGNHALLAFPVAESPTDLGTTTPPETIAGRESWVVEVGIGCTVYTKHIEFGLGAGTFEFAWLNVSKPGGACAAARALAADAWAHLPG